jgi:hypothetical protein
MIYGTVDNIEGLTIDSFLRNIDAESWRHFMPRGITMQLFKRLKHLYREDIFVATAKAIVARLRHADTLPPDSRIAEIASILSDFSFKLFRTSGTFGYASDRAIGYNTFYRTAITVFQVAAD